MQTTTVYLPDALKRRLAQAAHRRGQEVTTAAELVGRDGELRFRTMRPLWGEALTLLPADQS